MTALTILALPTSQLVLQSPVASATILPADDSARVGMETITRDLVQGNLFPIQVVLTANPETPAEKLLAVVDSVSSRCDRDRMSPPYRR